MTAEVIPIRQCESSELFKRYCDLLDRARETDGRDDWFKAGMAYQKFCDRFEEK